MFDCSKDVRAYHSQDVTLPKTEQDKMRNRRNSNRERLRKGLEKAGKPGPIEFVAQGSYAMKTMARDPDNDYDIDDGVYLITTSTMASISARKIWSAHAVSITTENCALLAIGNFSL